MTSLSIPDQGSAQPNSLADDIRLLAEAFAGRWLLIVGVLAVSVLLGVGYIWTTPPAYTSSVDIFIDPRERTLVDLGVAPSGLGTSSQGADSALVESQVAILQSRSVLTALAEQLNLAADPEFGGVAREGLGALLRDAGKSLLYGPNAGSYSQSVPLDRALDKLSRAIKVRRVDLTYVINVSVKTGSAQLSADLANALTAIYLAQSQGAVDSRALEAAETLESRLGELQQASEASQQAVEDFRRGNGLIGAENVLVDEQQLRDLNARVTEAVVATGNAKATLEAITLAGVATSSPLASEAITDLRAQLEEARSTELSLATQLGDRHPRLVEARNARQSLETALQAEFQRVLARATNEYATAQQTEAALKTLLSQYEQRRASSNDASVRLRSLEQAAKQNQELYENFAMRAKQAREQIALPTTTARIISSAEPASQPSEPRLVIVLGISVFAGLVLGFGLAWLLHLLHGRPTRRAARRPVVTAEDVRAAMSSRKRADLSTTMPAASIRKDASLRPRGPGQGAEMRRLPRTDLQS